ncbi:hypothetical protein ACYJW8_13675 [Frateuria aurantia]
MDVTQDGVDRGDAMQHRCPRHPGSAWSAVTSLCTPSIDLPERFHAMAQDRQRPDSMHCHVHSAETDASNFHLALSALPLNAVQPRPHGVSIDISDHGAMTPCRDILMKHLQTSMGDAVGHGPQGQVRRRPYVINGSQHDFDSFGPVDRLLAIAVVAVNARPSGCLVIYMGLTPGRRDRTSQELDTERPRLDNHDAHPRWPHLLIQVPDSPSTANLVAA